MVVVPLELCHLNPGLWLWALVYSQQAISVGYQFPHPRNLLTSETIVIVGDTVIQLLLGRRNVL
jgi:hypothetical protein